MSSWWVRRKGLRNRTHFLRSTSTERSTPSTLSVVEQPPWPSSRMRLTRSFPSSCAQQIHCLKQNYRVPFLRWGNFKWASVHCECLLCFGTIATLVTLTSWKAKQDFVSVCLQGRSLCLAWKLFSIFTNSLKSVCLHIHCPHRHSMLNNGDALASHRAWRVDKVSSCPIANQWISHGRTFVLQGIWGQRLGSLISSPRILFSGKFLCLGWVPMHWCRMDRRRCRVAFAGVWHRCHIVDTRRPSWHHWLRRCVQTAAHVWKCSDAVLGKVHPRSFQPSVLDGVMQWTLAD